MLVFLATSPLASISAGRLLLLGGLALAATLALARIFPRTRGTTLAAPWWWSVASVATLLSVEAWLGAADAEDWHTHVRYAAATSTFWPLMALLGAKRPQDRGWQFIVLSLGGVVLLPAGEGLLYSPGTPFVLPPAWSVFVVGLAGLGFFNGLPTRRWLATLFTAAGRVLLLAPAIRWTSELTASVQDAPTWGLGCIVAGWACDALIGPRCSAARDIDRVWLDFRDAFGLLWGLRVADRFNAAARQLQWGARLRWSGLDRESPDAERADAEVREAPRDLAPETAAAIRQNLEMLLRRFVSQEWFDRRWENRLD